MNGFRVPAVRFFFPWYHHTKKGLGLHPASKKMNINNLKLAKVKKKNKVKIQNVNNQEIDD